MLEFAGKISIQPQNIQLKLYYFLFQD